MPRRGDRRQLRELAVRNAAEALGRLRARRRAEAGGGGEALGALADALALPTAPGRIECFDISTIQGSDTVGSMVVFEDGVPRKSEYRRFRVRTVEGGDDYASHREVLRRRFRRVAPGGDGGAAAEDGAAEQPRWPVPDLVFIDGGRGQVSAAAAVLEELGFHDVPLAGLAKEREEIFLRGGTEPVVLPATSPALYLVQRLRDEAHRFAIGYHRSLRSRRQTRSALEDISGLGPVRRRALLRRFGSVRGLRDASIDEIAAVPGIGPGLAARVREALDA